MTLIFQRALKPCWRLVILILCLVVYMCVCAVVFNMLEKDNDMKQFVYYQNLKVAYKDKYNMSEEEFVKFAEDASVLYKRGYVKNYRDYWNFYHSFWFTTTVVTTMGSGTWSPWTNWSKCTLSCGRGTTSRTRNCTVASPRNNNTLCLGPDVELTFCVQPPCQDTRDVYPLKGRAKKKDFEEEPSARDVDLEVKPSGSKETRKKHAMLGSLILGVLFLAFLIFSTFFLTIRVNCKRRTAGELTETFDTSRHKLRVDLPNKSTTAVQSSAETYSTTITDSSRTTPMTWLNFSADFGSSMESLDNSCRKQRVDLADKTATAAAVESETWSCASASWESANECPFRVQTTPMPWLDYPAIFGSAMESLDTSCRKKQVDLSKKSAAAVESETCSCANASWESVKQCSSTDLSTPIGFSDSCLASCQSLVDSTAFPWVTFPPEVDGRFVSCAHVDHTGSRLTIPGTQISLFVPPLAFSKGRAETLYISLLKDQSKKNPPLDDTEALVSPVVVCGPNGTKFDKTVTISIPHSALMEEGSWNLRAKCDDSDRETLSEWKDMAPAFPDDMQFSQNMCQIRVDHFTLFGVVGASNNGRKRVKIVTYALFCDNVEDCWINVYCVDDTEAPLKLVDQQELAHGGRRVDVPKLMLFEDGGKDLTIRLEEQQSDWEVVASNNCQTIPFEQIWKQAPDGTPKCMFHLKRTGQSEQQLRCQIKAQQCPKEFEQEVLVSVELTQVGQVGYETFGPSWPWSVASAPEHSLLDQQPGNNEQICAEAACEQKTVNIVAYIRFSGSAGDCYIHIYCVDNIEELMDQGRRIDTPKLFTLENNNEDLKISLEDQPNGWREFPDRDVQSSCKIIPFDHIKKQAPGSNPCCTYLFRRTDQNKRQLRCHFKLFQRPGKFEQEILVSEELTNFTQVEGEATGMENGNMTPVSGSSGFFSLYNFNKAPEVSYTIPSQLRRKLAILLDPERDSDWRLLAEKMEVDSAYIDYMIHWLEGRAGKSPTDHLLTEKWKEQNRPLSDLPELLEVIGRFDALKATKDYLEDRETRL